VITFYVRINFFSKVSPMSDSTQADEGNLETSENFTMTIVTE